MATGPIDLLLNRNSTSDVVEAPAFSITKVLATASVILTPLVTYLANIIEDVDFSATHVVTLIVAVIGLLSVVGAADVLARAVATSRSSYPANPVDIEPPLSATWTKPGPDMSVRVIPARTRGAGAEFLVVTQDDKLMWVPQAQLVKFSSDRDVG